MFYGFSEAFAAWFIASHRQCQKAQTETSPLSCELNRSFTAGLKRSLRNSERDRTFHELHMPIELVGSAQSALVEIQSYVAIAVSSHMP